jgi:hypothetical protein
MVEGNRKMGMEAEKKQGKDRGEGKSREKNRETKRKVRWQRRQRDFSWIPPLI